MTRHLRSALVVIAGSLLMTAPAVRGTAAPAARLLFLDITGGRMLSASPDGSDVTVLLSGLSSAPDGIAVDAATGHIFWTNMGRADADDGSIDRVDLDGSHLTRMVPAGGTFTPKQLALDAGHGKLYWSDREGMRVMRSNVDGSHVQTLVVTGRDDLARRDAANWCVGVALDVERGRIYWTQKGGSNAGTGSIRRAGIEIPVGEDAAHRSDIEVLFDGLPEPIDLQLDPKSRLMYWTDRGNPPRGNTVSRAPMDPPAGSTPKQRADQQILVRDLKEGIGIALDLDGGRMFVTDLGGHVYRAKLDGSDAQTVLTGQGGLTGIAYVPAIAPTTPTAARR